MYSSAFRRLSSKTQIFHLQTADNLRTRLTHTLEVSQIARTISGQLGLDYEEIQLDIFPIGMILFRLPVSVQ